MDFRYLILRQEGEEPSGGFVRRAWENLRDTCDVIQDSKVFQLITLAIIVLNAIIMAINWWEAIDWIGEWLDMSFCSFYMVDN